MESTCSVDTSKLVPIASMVGDDMEDTKLLKQMAAEAASFLSSHHWCGSVDGQFLGYGVGGVVGVFLCLISPTAEDVDSCLWVVVGDLPPAYLITEENPDPASALDAYIDEMSSWVEAVEKGESTDDLIPVNVLPTMELAEQLRGRLVFLRERILPLIPSNA